MKNVLLFAVLMAVVFALPLSAGAQAAGATAEDEEVEFPEGPETVTIDGKQLNLNGEGVYQELRTTKTLFDTKDKNGKPAKGEMSEEDYVDLYAVGLYLEKPSQDAQQILSSQQLKRVRLVMMMDVDKKTLLAPLTQCLQKAGKLPALQPSLNLLSANIPDLKKGDEVLFTYTRGKGTTVQSKSGKDTIIPGNDFADALLSVWLGKDVVDTDLKEDLLGKEPSETEAGP